MNFLFLMDPLSTVKMEKDTSFILMHGAMQKGHKVFYLPDGNITFDKNRLEFDVTPVIPQKIAGSPFVEQEPVRLGQDDVDAVFIRSDPPFDAQYLLNTWLLDRLPESIPVINAPAGIRAANEKIWATRFPDLIPRTMIGRHRQYLLGFLKEEKDIIAKPVNGFGGASVFHIRQGDRNAIVILETLTRQWQEDIILQRYLPAAEQGDKRILLLNGEPLGAVLRMHSDEDHRNNFFSGGKPLACEITKADQAIIARLKEPLKRTGLYFVGIDIIGDYLVEVNVTSPTCLQEINFLYNKALEIEVIEFVEGLIEEKNRHKTRGANRG